MNLIGLFSQSVQFYSWVHARLLQSVGSGCNCHERCPDRKEATVAKHKF